MGGNSQMGGPSTVQPTGNAMASPPPVQPNMQQNGPSLASLFAGSQGYQQPQMPQAMAPPPPAIQQPSYGQPAMTPQQAALATQARMQLRTPPVVPAAAAQQQSGGHWELTGAHGGGGERWVNNTPAPNQIRSSPPKFNP